MLPRRPLAAGDTFSFSNPTPNQERKITSRSGELEYNKWAEMIKSQPSHFGKPADAKFGAWTRKTTEDDSKSSTPSPELWKRPESQSAGSSPAQNHASGCHISHGARAQTIAKYRQEMLDLVKGMPETAYELSLRDIVESPKITTPLQDRSGEIKSSKKRIKKERGISRSESLDNGGLLLKMFMPKVPSLLGGRKSTSNSGPCAKVSPNMAGEGEKSGSEKSSGGGGGEWWSSEFGQMTSSSSSGSSSSSNGSGRRTSR